MPPRAARPPADTGDRPGRPQRPRRFTASYKIGILERYDTLDRTGKTALLREEGLRASQVSKWRAQVYAAARSALSAEPGRQPARRIHLRQPVGRARHDRRYAGPPMSPERLVRALCASFTGRDHLFQWQLRSAVEAGQ